MKRVFSLCLAVSASLMLAVSAYAQVSPNDPGYDGERSYGPPVIISYGGGTSALQAAGADTCDCLDLVLVIDDTGSMIFAISNVKVGIADILALADSICGDVQAGLVTFKDDVEVDVPLTPVLANVSAGVAALVATGGVEEPEASDEALLEVISAAGTNCALTGDFDPGNFRDQCCKVIILVTDARPGGCDDLYTPGVDDVHADQVANLAAINGCTIGALYTETFLTESATIIPIMQNYAAKTGGVYGQTPSDGTGTADAMKQVILDCIEAADTELCCTPVGCVEVLTGSCVPSGGFIVANCSACAVAVEHKTWGSIKELYKSDEE